VFVCSHGRRDMRCGVIGPALIDAFERELRPRDGAKVAIRPCTHVGGHKYAGNVIVHGRGEGHWYGYVDSELAAEIAKSHVLGGEPVIRPKLWRGQLGLDEGAQGRKCEECMRGAEGAS